MPPARHLDVWLSIDRIVRFWLIQDRLPRPPQRILEVGCGDGRLMQSLAALGHDVLGCDLSLELFPRASPVRRRVFAASGGALPIPSDSMDCVVSSDVLEHVAPHAREQFLEELVRVTRPGGTIVLSAFFHLTLGFRLLGALLLLRHGTLPGWYVEHLVIPSPRPEEARAFLSRRLEGVRAEAYQSPLNLFLFGMQLASFPDGVGFLDGVRGGWRVNRAIGRLSKVVHRLVSRTAPVLMRVDRVGKRTSYVFVGTKPRR